MNNSKLRIMLVDDQSLFREALHTLLSLQPDFEIVAEAENGERALSLAKVHRPDVILMDLRMPGLDGPGALRRIRSVEGPNDATPIIAFTADADTALVASLLAFGFQDVVAKPLEPGVLIGAVARATAFAAAQEDLQSPEIAHAT